MNRSEAQDVEGNEKESVNPEERNRYGNISSKRITRNSRSSIERTSDP